MSTVFYIHQMWLDRDDVEFDSEYPPEPYKTRYADKMASWKSLPNTVYCFWNNLKVNKLLDSVHFWKHDLRKHIEKCDFARYLILWLYGGLYIDLDVTCLDTTTSPREWLSKFNRNIVVEMEPKHHWIMKQPRASNAVLAALLPGDPTWITLMEWIKEKYKWWMVPHWSTGPNAVYNCFTAHGVPIVDYGQLTDQYLDIDWRNDTGWGWKDMWSVYRGPFLLSLAIFCLTVLIGVLISFLFLFR